jgi:hypothetical protein
MNNITLEEVGKTVSSIKPTGTRSLFIDCDFYLCDNISGTNYKRNIRLRVRTLRVGKIRKIIKNI